MRKALYSCLALMLTFSSAPAQQIDLPNPVIPGEPLVAALPPGQGVSVDATSSSGGRGAGTLSPGGDIGVAFDGPARLLGTGDGPDSDLTFAVGSDGLVSEVPVIDMGMPAIGNSPGRGTPPNMGNLPGIGNLPNRGELPNKGDMPNIGEIVSSIKGNLPLGRPKVPAPAAAVPEPSTLAVWSILVVFGIVAGRRLRSR